MVRALVAVPVLSAALLGLTALPAAADVPAVVSVTPAWGATGGETTVVVAGSGFTDATGVDFGGTPATDVVVISDGLVSAIAPGGAGAVDVTVTDPDGPSPTSPADVYTYDTTPSVAGVSPAGGSTAGGSTVEIDGAGFEGATDVAFGQAAAASFTVVSDAEIIAVSPPGWGTSDVTVTSADGTSATTSQDSFTWSSTPAVTSIAPAGGPTAGGTTITIAGSGLEGTQSVEFGSAPATSVSVLSDGEVTATSPPGAGTADVVVTTDDGSSAATPADLFTWDTVLSVTAGTLSAGPAAGDTLVTISGEGFEGTSSVSVGGVAATSVDVISDSEITVRTPAHAAGSGAVTVTTPNGTSTGGGSTDFDFVPAPVVTGLSPAAGPEAGGTQVTLTGSTFGGATAVAFGTIPAVIDKASATSMVVTAPKGTGTVHVTVTTPDGTSPVAGSPTFAFVAPPAVAKLSPAAGPLAGGTIVTVDGSNLAGATAVHFGTAAARIVKISAGSIEVAAPRGSGTVGVTVTTAGGTSPAAKAASYTFVPAPSVAKLSPDFGPTTGGTLVTITGANLAGTTAVHFGNTAAHVVKVSATSVEVTAPAGSGTVNLVVTTAGGNSAIVGVDHYTYTAPFGEGLPRARRVPRAPAARLCARTAGFVCFVHTMVGEADERATAGAGNPAPAATGARGFSRRRAGRRRHPLPRAG